MKAVHLGIRVGRLARDQQPRADARVIVLQSLYHGDCGVLRAADCEQDLERRVLLFKKSPQVVFQALIRPGQRLEDADGWRNSQWRRLDPAIAAGSHGREDAVSQ